MGQDGCNAWEGFFLMAQEANFGEWLRQRRKELDLTQDALAERIGCSRNTIQKIEVGVRRPSKQVAELLSACLGIPAAEQAAFVRWARLGGKQPQLTLSASTTVSPPPLSVQLPESYPCSNLPTPLTPLIGREQEVERIRTYLLRDDVRLLTLTGPPGIGKTRLSFAAAARVAESFPGGVYFVPLEAVNDIIGVIPAIGHALGLKESGNQIMTDLIGRFLSDKQALLVVDNFEQVLDAGQQMLQLLRECPRTKALVTSREPLHIYGEWRFPVPPLALPNRARLQDMGELARVASVALFTQRAQALDLDFALTRETAGVVADICVQLDGLPLAIELAAAHVERLTPARIRAGLDDRLKLLRGGPRDLPPRHQTLRGAIDWSYHLLTGAERVLLRRLSVFAGGCSLDAARAVCNAGADLAFDIEEGLASLVSKSLLRRESGPEGEPRVAMLESIRQYAGEKLAASGEADEIHRHHAEYYLRLAEAAHPHLFERDQLMWLDRLEQDHDNIRAALAWSIDQRHNATEIALRLSAAQNKFWYMHGYAREARRWLQTALELPPPSQDKNATSMSETSSYAALRACVLRALGASAYFLGDFEAARSYNQEGLLLAQQAGDRANVAACLMNLGTITGQVGEYDQGRVLLSQALSLARELGDKSITMLALDNLGHMAVALGENASARSFLRESLAIEREMGDRYSMAYTLIDLAEIAIEEQDYEDANRLLDEGVSINREMADELGVGRCLAQFANLARATCNYQKAEEFYKEGLVLSGKVGDKAGIIDALQQIAELDLYLGQAAQAVRLWSAAEMISSSVGSPTRQKYRPRYEQSLARARTHLGEEVFEQAWAEGKTITIEQAVEMVRANSG